MATRSRLHQDQRRAQLLELGARLFTAHAYDDVSIENIAAEAGISKGLLYHYFPSKRELYVATLKINAAGLVSAVEPDRNQRRLDRLQASLDAFLDHVQANAAGYASLLRGGIGSDPEVSAVVDDTRQSIIAIIFDNMGVSNPSAALRLALRGWLGFMEAAAVDWAERGGVGRERMRTMAVEVLQTAIAQAAQDSVSDAGGNA